MVCSPEALCLFTDEFDWQVSFTFWSIKWLNT